MIIPMAKKGVMRWSLVRMYNLPEHNFAKGFDKNNFIKSLKFTIF